MKFVEPIKTIEEIRAINDYFKTNKRNYLLFNFGINTPIRAKDLLTLKTKDVIEKENINIVVGKKIINFPLGNNLKKIIKDYCQDKESNEYLFKNERSSLNKSISLSQVNKILVKCGNSLNIDNLGASTLRKTFAYHYYKRTKNIGRLMKLLNHHDQYYTLQYIGLNKKYFDNVENEFKELF